MAAARTIPLNLASDAPTRRQIELLTGPEGLHGFVGTLFLSTRFLLLKYFSEHTTKETPR
jgi:hypothetical protein